MAKFFNSNPGCLAVICVALASLASSVAAESGGARALSPSLEEKKPARKLETAALPAPAVKGQTSAATAVTAPSSELAAKLEPLRGDSALKGELDLSNAVLDKDHYQVALSGSRQAILTLDPQLQRAAEETLAKARAPFGAIVVMAPDGRILALAGRRNRAPARKRDFSLPLSVWAPAASVFKIVTAAALIERGVAPHARVCYHGGLRSVVASNLRDHPKRDRRCADLAYGVAKSQNALIAKLAHRHLSPERLRSAARTFGFDSAPVFGLEVEASRADIPDEPLPFARVSAGFWKTELSPLGGALVANLIAANGMSVTPRIVESIVDAEGRTRRVESVRPRRALGKKVAAQVARAMVATTERGTAYKGFHDRRGRRYLGEVEVAGKTGTLSRGTTKRGDEYVQYSWFVGFAPADAPKLTIAVLLGNPPKWHLKAHTAARLVLQQAL